MEVKPFVKWAGGKSQLLPQIGNLYPDELGRSIQKYAEPFVGGGAVLFDILSKYNLESVFINDVNKELINVYRIVQSDSESLIDALKELRNRFLSADEPFRKEFFYEKRARFNELKDQSELGVESAALLIFLNKTCFNGLYRVNGKGHFNVPFNNAKNPSVLDEKNIKEIAKKLQNAIICCGDYKKSAEFIDDKTFVYFDPPYRPLNRTSSFTAYSQEGFSDSDQIELSRFFAFVTEKGAKAVLSNSDPKGQNEDDLFFDHLYSRYSIQRVGATRMINSKGEKRGSVSELIVCNFCKNGEKND